ncbi:MAG: hypothetical protein OEY29_03965 [Gammaproteobacteria bacterium]|nr:hypothetical protein [Gammaproteobacteria bacterium]
MRSTIEIDDVLAKLQALNLLQTDNDGFTARAISQAIKSLNRHWDEYFTPL